MELEELAESGWSTALDADGRFDLSSEQNMNLQHPPGIPFYTAWITEPDWVDAYEL